ncbi:MAG TPA: c-type cytochrome [Steroidobacteraceae bacterium]|jgi:cytochrome c oxidase cbb3-type subunit 3|nr:c-type cytochrome [Steroidobacteraceae bacterium]
MALACLMAAVQLHSSQIEGRLLRSDPNSIPSSAALMLFARERGGALFGVHCAVCHGQLGQGDTERGIPDLTDDDWLYGMGSVSDIEQIVKYGIRSSNPKAWNLAIMPAYARARPSVRDSKIPALSPANIRDLAEFLIREQGRAGDTAAATRGAELFAAEGGCYDCHAADGRGDPAVGAPNLTDRITLYGDGSRESLSMSIAYGRHGVCPAWATRIGAAEIREVALFVYSLSHEPRRTETDRHAESD